MVIWNYSLEIMNNQYDSYNISKIVDDITEYSGDITRRSSLRLITNSLYVGDDIMVINIIIEYKDPTA